MSPACDRKRVVTSGPACLPTGGHAFTAGPGWLSWAPRTLLRTARQVASVLRVCPVCEMGDVQNCTASCVSVEGLPCLGNGWCPELHGNLRQCWGFALYGKWVMSRTARQLASVLKVCPVWEMGDVQNCAASCVSVEGLPRLGNGWCPNSISRERGSDERKRFAYIRISYRSSSFSWCILCVCPLIALLKAIDPPKCAHCFVLCKLKSVDIICICKCCTWIEQVMPILWSAWSHLGDVNVTHSCMLQFSCVCGLLWLVSLLVVQWTTCFVNGIEHIVFNCEALYYGWTLSMEDDGRTDTVNGNMWVEIGNGKLWMDIFSGRLCYIIIILCCLQKHEQVQSRWALYAVDVWVTES